MLSLTPERLQALSGASTEALIAISGPLQSRVLADLATVEKLRGSSPEQIAAMGALNNPAYADAYKDILLGLARTGDLEPYERLVSEMKESSQLSREEHQRNQDMMLEMFHKAVDTLSETAVAFSGRPAEQAIDSE